MCVKMLLITPRPGWVEKTLGLDEVAIGVAQEAMVDVVFPLAGRNYGTTFCDECHPRNLLKADDICDTMDMAQFSAVKGARAAEI